MHINEKIMKKVIEKTEDDISMKELLMDILVRETDLMGKYKDYYKEKVENYYEKIKGI